VLERSHPDAVLVTIPDAPRDRLDELIAECERGSIACRFVRREQLDAADVLGAGAQ
jgi:hypothetical protein